MDVFRCVEKAAGRPDKAALCTEANIATHKDFVRAFFEAAVSVICGEFNEHTDRCDRYQRVQLEVNSADKGNVDKKNSTGEEEEEEEEEEEGSYQRPPSYFGPLVHNLANL